MLDIRQQIASGCVLLVDKPLTWTSFDAVNIIKSHFRKLQPKLKIGHAGTLDPLADGLLIICTQNFTKTIESIQIQKKTYVAEIFIGATRPSFDRETEIDQSFPFEHITEALIKETLESFLGVQQQFPPVFSAIKQGGKPIYLKARKGIEVEVKSKEIEIYHIEFQGYKNQILTIEVSCSKGTYIRSLANDIGKKLHSGAYLHALTRTKIGDYSLENAYKLDDLIAQIRETPVELQS
jgi:tRNA pseudouridine55 synthase